MFDKKACDREYHKKYYPEHREQILAYGKKWAKENRERKNAIARKSRQLHAPPKKTKKEIYDARIKKWDDAHPEDAKARKEAIWQKHLSILGQTKLTEKE